MIDQAIDLTMNIVGSSSAVSSFCVIICYLTCESVRNKTYNALIYLVTVCDFFAAIGTSLGQTSDRTFLCWFQGLFTNYFPLAAVAWTTLIAYTLYVTVYRKIGQVINVFNNFSFILCWIVPMILTLLPLSTNRYGLISEDGIRGWCYIASRHDSPNWTTKFWTISAFYIWIWLAVSIYCVFLIVAFSSLKNIDISNTLNNKHPLAWTAVAKLSWYPLNMVMCWGFTCVVDIYTAFFGQSFLNKGLCAYFAYTLPGYLGLLNAIAFFRSNKYAWNHFIGILWKIFCLPIYSLLQCVCNYGDRDSESLLNVNSHADQASGGFGNGDEEEDELSNIISFGSLMETIVIKSGTEVFSTSSLSIASFVSFSSRNSGQIAESARQSSQSSNKPSISITNVTTASESKRDSSISKFKFGFRQSA